MKVKILTILFVAFSFAISTSAQTVTNVVARQIGNTVEITYDLDEPSKVTLLFSRDGGETYPEKPKSVSGDVGNYISAGHNKIIWDLFADGSDWDIARARFKVEAVLQEKLTFIVEGVSFTLISVRGGTFTMGCTSEQGSACDVDEKPCHQVTLDDYYIGQTEVTQGLWKAVMGSNPSNFQKGDNYPVEQVSWNDCGKFINRLNRLLSDQLGEKRFTLPTEAEWEYAARGGHKNSTSYKYSGSNEIHSVAWYDGNSGSTTHPVAQKTANALGIYDMSGNVYEWCYDWYGSYSSSAEVNPNGSSSGSARVLRGGSWYDLAKYCRVAYRGSNTPTNRYGNFGLRLVLH